MAEVADLYLPDDCWEYVFKFLKKSYDDGLNSDLKSLSVVCKQFLSVTNHLRFSITINKTTHHFLIRLFQRFPNLTSLKLTGRFGGLYCLFPFLDSNSFVLSTQLKSLHLNSNLWLGDERIQMLSLFFPNLQYLDLSYCYNVSEQGIFQVLRTCSNIRHLNLTSCVGVNLHGMNFEVPKLEVLKLSCEYGIMYHDVPKLEFLKLLRQCVLDETLYVISKSCCGLLELHLQYCNYVTEKGVKHVVENCTKLRD